jgi:hypothetical protein
MSKGNPFTIGRDCSLVLLYNGSRLDLEKVTGFTAAQEVKQQRSDPLNGVPIEFNTPSGWRGRFMVDRATSALDDLIAAIEAAFWNAGTIGSGTIYQYVTETDGSLSTYEFSGVSLTLTDAGTFQQESIVKQTLGFFASIRTRL